MKLTTLPFFDRLEHSQRILLAGMGGGFDLYCGLPLYFALTEAGKSVTLANLTFANTRRITPRLEEAAVEVTARSGQARGYFPERHLCAWMEEETGEPFSIVCFERHGAVALREAYQRVVEHFDIDALVLVDGGTDALMRGDEAGLGTPHEDILSLAVTHDLDIPTKLMACLGFGIDAFHGVCHAHMLENVAELAKNDAFLGTFSLLKQMSEAQRYLKAVDYSNTRTPGLESIVNNSIASAVEGHYGNHHRTNRVRQSRLWINPLMSIYWAFELAPVAERILYLDHIKDTETFQDVIVALEAWERDRPRRPRRDIPV